MMLKGSRPLCSFAGPCQRYLHASTIRPSSTHVEDGVAVTKKSKVKLKQSKTLFWVPRSIGGVIYGKRQTITDEIRKNATTSWVNIKVDFGSIKDGHVAVSVRGTTEACIKAGETFKKIKDSETTDIIWVPAPDCGMIMGSSGAKVKEIARDTNTLVQIDQSEAKEGLVPITIKGQPEACKNAREIIKNLTDSKTTDTMWVSATDCALIMGNSGATIKQIARDTNTHIKMDQTGVNEGLVPITVIGEPEACADAKNAIERLTESKITDTMWVPDADCAMILGQSGSTVRKIARDTKTYIHIDQANAKEGLVPLTIRGQPEECMKAREVIEGLTVSKTTDTMWLPDADCGLIIGMSGTTIQKISSDTNTHIFIDQAAVKEGLVPVIIKGQPQACLNARETIDRLLQDIEVETFWVPDSDCGILFGKSGSTIKIITSDTNTYIHIDQAAVKEGLVPLTIRGQPEARVNARETIERLLHDMDMIWVSKSHCGIILGYSGQTIEKINSDTNASIQIDHAAAKEDLVPVIIRGHPEDRAKAIERIRQLRDSQTTDTMWVSHTDCRMVFGESSETIKKIAGDTNTHIKVNLSALKEGIVPVTITGEHEGSRAEARKMIEGIVNDTDTMWVSDADYGIIFGKSSATIKKIVQGTNTHIRIDQDAAKEGLVPVTIRGEPEARLSARKIIEGILGESKTIIWLPKIIKSALVGPGRTRLEKNTGASITLLRATENEGCIPVTLRGSSENCDAAVKAIQIMIDELVDSASILWIPVEKAFGKKAYPTYEEIHAANFNGICIEIGKSLTTDGFVDVTIMAHDSELVDAARGRIIDIIGSEHRIDDLKSVEVKSKLHADVHKLWCIHNSWARGGRTF